MPHANWDGTEMPSQAGKIAIVTGANQGIGFVTARRLAERGARVILACRNEERGRRAQQDIRERLQKVGSSGSVELLLVDVGSLESVRAFAAAVRERVDRVDLLINNAGVALPADALSTDGLAIQFGVNYLGHFHLTTLLFDLLRASEAARVINIASVAHRQQASRYTFGSVDLNFAKLATGEGDRPWGRYEKSKLCALVFTNELDRRLRAAQIPNVRAICAHPGVCHTNIFDEAIHTTLPWFLHSIAWYVNHWTLQSAEMGALPVLYAATMADVDGGEYYGPRGLLNWYGYPAREVSYPASHDPDYGRGLWALSERLTETAFNVR